MAKAVFISFDHDDAHQVGGLRATVSNKNNDLEFLDRSLQEPVRDSRGNPILFQPTDPAAENVRREIRALMDQASRLLVLIGRNTHSSSWVKWEIGEFIARKNLDSGTGRILCMRLKGDTTSGSPAIVRDYGIQVINWDIDFLSRWAS